MIGGGFLQIKSDDGADVGIAKGSIGIHRHHVRRRLASISHRRAELEPSDCAVFAGADAGSCSAPRHVGAHLSFADPARFTNSRLGSLVSLAGQPQGGDQEHGADPNKDGRDQAVERHALGGVIHGLRSQVHALLGGQVVYLVLAGLGLAALAGLGGGLILDNVNTNKRRRSLGWLLLLAGLPLFGLCFFLGLP